MGKLSKQWWCIKHGCRYNRIHYTHRGTVMEHIGCSHPDLLSMAGPTNPNLGVPISDLQMCPVLVNERNYVDFTKHFIYTP